MLSDTTITIIPKKYSKLGCASYDQITVFSDFKTIHSGKTIGIPNSESDFFEPFESSTQNDKNKNSDNDSTSISLEEQKNIVDKQLQTISKIIEELDRFLDEKEEEFDPMLLIDERLVIEPKRRYKIKIRIKNIRKGKIQ